MTRLNVMPAAAVIVEVVSHRLDDRELVGDGRRLGRCSQIRSPGVRLAIGWNGPRIVSGASGFMSNVSS